VDFPDLPVQQINSISQRALFNHWSEAAGKNAFPSIDDFDPGERVHDPKQLIIWRVEQNEGQYQFRALYQGGHISNAFGASWAGKTMDEVVPEFARYIVIASAKACVRSGCAIYSVFRTTDPNGRAIDCERLLLPLGRRAVEQIVASVQLVSLKGEFQRDTVVKGFEARMDLVLAGKIGKTSPLAERRKETPPQRPQLAPSAPRR
jgi:hypothetical protein